METPLGFYQWQNLIAGFILIGALNPSEKYEFVNWDDYSQYMEK